MKRWAFFLLGFLILGSLISEFFFLYDYPAKHWWSSIPAFYSLLGFIGCIAIIFISKWLGRLFIQKKENFYDDV